MKELICKQCGKKFYVKNYRFKTAKFCSSECKGKNMKLMGIKPPSRKGILNSIEANKKNSEAHKGIKHTEEHKRKSSEAKKGSKNPMWGKHPSEKHRKKMSEMSGEKHWNWQGGITSEYMKSRNSIQTKLWRTAVFERDNYQCQKYGGGSGKLNAHHIQNFSHFPELRFAIDNGITLSDKAHWDFHKKYGRINNTKEQLLEFLNKKELCYK